MKVFKQESTQRTSKAFKQHTFAVLFDHSVFWQGAPIPQKMGIKSSLSVGLGESLASSNSPQRSTPPTMHNNSAQRSAFSFKQWSNSSSTWEAFASPLIKLFIAAVFLCTSMATAQVGIHGELYIAPDAQIALHGPTHFVQGNITTDPLSPSPLWIAPTASIVAASPAAYSEAPIHSLGHNDLLFATGKEGSYHPLRITNGNNSPLTVDYAASGPVGTNNTQGITSVSNTFHWTVAGSQQAEVTLSWSAEHQITTLTDRVEDLIIVGYDGFNWEELPATLVNGTLTQGALTTTAPVDFSNYSALTLGTKFSSDTPIVNQGLTPNGDGVNDGWVIEGIENHPDAQIRVFSRWGREVFAHNGPNPYNNDWTGIYRSARLPAGAYYYRIDLDADGQVDMEGWIYIGD